MRTLAEHWRSFDTDILNPANAGAVQRQETRRAFYAGAQALFGLMVTECSDVSDEAGADVMEALNAELHAFVADVKAGRA